ncbi:MAG TPA: TldD/PmbA family protein [Polyangiaceae bacterium]
MLSRRAFVIHSSLAALGVGCHAASKGRPLRAGAPTATIDGGASRPLPDAELAKVLARALDAAKRAGATFADARIHQRRYESLRTREDHVVDVHFSESFGLALRVLAFGAWGFASSPRAMLTDADEVARRAISVAKANADAQKRKIALAPVSAVTDRWQTPLSVDPFKVPLADKAALLLSFWPEAKKVSGVAFLDASAEAIDEWKLLATTDGSVIEQRIVRVGAGYSVTAKNEKTGEFVTRAHELPPMQAGWEYVTESSLFADARKMGEDVVEKLKSPSVRAGKKDLVLAPSNLWLTIHESVGHPTELDRILGYEADLAGTSFATVEKLGKLKYASDIVSLAADKTTPGGLATCAYDDEGTRTQRWLLVDKGLLVGFQTTRDQASWIGEKESRGTAYAEDHESFPFQRMPNVSLLSGDKPLKVEDLVAATDDGILITGNGSWSIDQQRYNFQFGGQMFYEIKKGKVTHALKDVAYQANSLDFWKSCDMVGGQESWKLHGTLSDGKGEPVQSNPVSHGCPPARFRRVNILNTNRRGGS